MINRLFRNAHSYSGELSKTVHSGRVTLQVKAIDDVRKPTCTVYKLIIMLYYMFNIIASYFFALSFSYQAQICLAR